MPPLQPEGKLSWLLSSGQSRPGQRLHRVFSGAATRAILLLALTYNKHLSAASIYLPINGVSIISLWLLLCNGERGSKQTFPGAGSSGLVTWAGVRACPRCCPKRGSRAWNFSRQPGDTTSGYSLTVMWRLIQAIGGKILFQLKQGACTARAWDSITALMRNSQSQANESTWISLIWKSERIIFSYLVDPLQEIFISTWEAIRPSPWWVP